MIPKKSIIVKITYRSLFYPLWRGSWKKMCTYFRNTTFCLLIYCFIFHFHYTLTNNHYISGHHRSALSFLTASQGQAAGIDPAGWQVLECAAHLELSLLEAAPCTGNPTTFHIYNNNNILTLRNLDVRWKTIESLP